jgi:hypothetical protein
MITPNINWFNAWAEMVFLSFFLFLFFLSDLCVGYVENQTSPLIFFLSIQSLFSYLHFFNLYWLFLIGFCFWFHPWLFDFLNLFSNLVLFLLIAIYFVLNCFFVWFFFYYFTLYIYFGLIFMSNLVMFLLVDIFKSFCWWIGFTISSLNI